MFKFELCKLITSILCTTNYIYFSVIIRYMYSALHLFNHTIILKQYIYKFT